MLILTACSGPPARPGSPDAAATVATPPAPSPAKGAESTPGLRVDRHGPLTIVRIDPRHWRFRLLAANQLGGAHTAAQWARKHGLGGAINASMFHADYRSIGMLADGELVNNARDNDRLGGFFFWDPVDPGDAPVRFVGRGCPGVDVAALRKRYRGVAQNYRMLGCDGEPLVWADPKEFSAAAIGLDADGNVVYLHSRKPHVMTEFNQLVATPELKIVAAHYVEGGPEASLFVDTGDVRVEEVGSFESLFNENDDNRAFWPIPNVIGFTRRSAAASP